MDLPSLKDLNKIIALCRKQGVKVIKIGEIELTLGDQAPKLPKKNTKTQETQGDVETDGWDSLTPEEQLLWSANGGMPVITAEGDSK